jgi:hypothetical protein
MNNPLKKSLQEQLEKIRNQLELIENQEKTEQNKDILEAIKGTSWMITKPHQSSVESYGKRTHFHELVYKHLYPHGHAFLTDSISINCDDSTIFLRYENIGGDFFNDDEAGTKMLTSLIPFFKEHNLTLDVSFATKSYLEQQKSIEEELTLLQLVHKMFS